MIGTTRHYASGRIFAAVAVSALVVWGCKSFEGTTVLVKPNPLEVHADSVKAEVRASVPPGTKMKKGSKYVGQLVITDSTNNFQLTNITLAADKYPDLKEKGARVSVNIADKFQEGMDGGELQVQGYYERKGKKTELPAQKLAPCCITTSRLYCENFAGGDGDKLSDGPFILSEYRYEQMAPMTLTARIQFPQNVFDIQPTELEKEAVKKIAEFLQKKYTASSAVIEGFASPEGTFRRNTFLSVERSKQVRTWLSNELQKYGYNAYLDSTFFKITTTSEDWEGFKANLDKTNHPEDVKRQIIQIISAGYEEDVKEKKVMALVGGEKEVEFILAPLRRATIRLEGSTAAHSNDQIRQMLSDYMGNRKTKDDLKGFFTADEMLYGISLFDKTEDKKKLLTAFTTTFPDDFRGYNDLGVYALRAGEVDKAIEYLNSAKSKKDKEHGVLNNLGVAEIMKKNYPAGLTNLQESFALKNTQQAAYNMGLIYIKRADYSNAADMFDAAGTLKCAKYNAGLAKVLLNDLTGAKADLETAIRMDKNYALNYYLLAIVGARSADSNLLFENLKYAAQMDRNLGKKSVKDLEFRRYSSSADFKEAAGE